MKITFSSLVGSAKLVIAAATIIVTLYGVFYAYYNFMENSKDLNSKVEILIENDSLFYNKLIKINDNLENTNILTIQTKSQVDALQNSYINFLKHNDALTKEDFLEYMLSLDIEVEQKKTTAVNQIRSSKY